MTQLPLVYVSNVQAVSCQEVNAHEAGASRDEDVLNIVAWFEFGGADELQRLVVIVGRK